MKKIKTIEKTFKALSDKSRLRILYMLSKKSLCVCEITSILKLSQSTISGHLKVLRDADLVEVEKSGLFVEYHLINDNDFLNNIMKSMIKEVEKDSILQNDLEKSLKTDRYELCKK